MRRIFKTDEELSPKEMVQYGLDHMGAGFYLFRDRPEFYDSAGYLMHIGYECLLKGWWLELDKEIHAEHDLIKISKKIPDFHYDRLQPEFKKTISMINGFQNLRYPNLINPIEIGNQILEPILELVRFTLLNIPSTIRPEEKTEHIQKGNRILMKKPIMSVAKKKVAAKKKVS